MSLHREDRGQAIVLVAIVASALLLGLGIAIDSGELYVARRAAQNAADAAAWAGGVTLYNGGTAAAAQTEAASEATRNGYSSGVTAVSPPASGVVAGDVRFIEVTISQTVPGRFFTGSRTVSVRSVGGSSRSGGGDAVRVLHPSNNDALSLTGSADLAVTGSGIRVNSTGGTAVNIESGTISSPYTRIRGNPGISAGDASKVTPAAVGNQTVPTPADPIAGLAIPPNPGAGSAAVSVGSGTTTLSAGRYNGGIQVTGGTLNLNPGIYILRGSSGTNYGFNIDGGTVNVLGTGGVLIYLTHDNYPAAADGTPNCGVFDLNSSGAITLTPRTSGAYAGLVIWQDAACTGTMTWRNSGARNLTGTVYVPGATLSVSATGPRTLAGQLVVRQYAASSDLTVSFSAANVMGARAPSLVE